MTDLMSNPEPTPALAHTIVTEYPLIDDQVVTDQITITNGMLRVSIGTTRRKHRLNDPDRHTSVSIPHDQAVEFAVALLNAARNVKFGIHGNSAIAEFADQRRAYDHLNEVMHERQK